MKFVRDSSKVNKFSGQMLGWQRWRHSAVQLGTAAAAATFQCNHFNEIYAFPLKGALCLEAKCVES